MKITMMALSALAAAAVMISSCGGGKSETLEKEEINQQEENTTTFTYKCVPVCHLLICCRALNNGTKFLVNGGWNASHNYLDIEQVRDIMQKIKDAGIKVVSVDFTNPAEWENAGGYIHLDGQTDAYNWPGYGKMLDNIVQVCEEIDMQFVIFIGNPAAHSFEYWNMVAGFIWENYAQKDSYRKYGKGDDRPILPVYLPGETFWPLYNNLSDDQKDNFEKFHIGTCQVNDPIKETTSDGWGYRNYSQSSDKKVRFCCPNSGVPPQNWARVDAVEWERRVKWCLGASDYAVLGSYDDTCDAIFWGIADVSGSKTECHKNSSTSSNPSAYYDVVKRILTSSK